MLSLKSWYTRAAFVGLIVTCFATAFLICGRNEPSYNTRSLSSWALIYYTNHNFRVVTILSPSLKSRQKDEAACAIKTIGTNALPYLMDWLKYERPKWKDTLAALPLPISLWSKISSRLNRPDQLHDAAPETIELLGAAAGSLAKDIRALSKSSQSTETRDRLLLVLAHLGQPGLDLLKSDLEIGSLKDARSATKALWIASHVDNTDIRTVIPFILLYEERCYQANEETLVGSDAAKYLPEILSSSTNLNPLIRAAAVQQLGWMKNRYPEAKTRIDSAMSDVDPRVCAAATDAISVMLPDAQKTRNDQSRSDDLANMFGGWVSAKKHHFRVTLSQTNSN